MSPDFSTELLGFLDSMGSPDSEGSIAVFHATLDDVGTCKVDGINAVVGYVASKAQWDYFNGRWQKALDDAGIEFLHTSNYLNKFPLVGNIPISDDDIFNILKPFIEVIHEVIFRPPSNVSKPGFAVCVVTPCDAYEELTSEEKKFVRPPELNSFEMAIGLSCAQIRNDLSNANPIAVQMDESEDIAKLCERYLALKKENESLRKYLGAICFADDKKLRPVQAADMLGNLTLKAWRAHRAKKDFPKAFLHLIFPDGVQGPPISRLICDVDRLRLWARMRKDRHDRMAMPDEPL